MANQRSNTTNYLNEFAGAFLKSFVVSYGVSYALTKWANSDNGRKDKNNQSNYTNRR